MLKRNAWQSLKQKILSALVQEDVYDQDRSYIPEIDPTIMRGLLVLVKHAALIFYN